MEINQKLMQINIFFNEKKYKEAMSLTQEVLALEPENVYAKKYSDLIHPYLNDKSEVWKIPTVKWKSLRCLHCLSAISFSALNEEQKEKIRNNFYENLSIKCPYCNTNFTLQKKSAESVIWIKIWDKINYLWKNYRATWYVKYAWKWDDWLYSWRLDYLEWILLWEDNSYLYFSEWTYTDDWQIKQEYEFSKKVSPDFDVRLDWNDLFINEQKRKIWDINDVYVSSLYGENSKVFQIWEKVKLYNFSYSSNNYVLEKEKVGRQSEAGIYQTWEVSRREAFKIFQKEYKIDTTWVWSFSWWSVWVYGFFATILIPWMDWLSSFLSSPWVIFAFLLIISICLYYLNPALKRSKFFHIFLTWPTLGFLAFLIWNFILENNKIIILNEISDWKKYEVILPLDLQTTDLEKTVKYDYWWVESIFKTNEWLKFSVWTDKDREIIEKLKKWDYSDEKLKRIFENNILKLK